MIVARPLRNRRQIGGFFNRQLITGFIEIIERSRCNAIRAIAEINLVQIKLEDFVLGERFFHATRDQPFTHLAFDLLFARQKEILRDLLRNGRTALKAASTEEIADVRNL